MHMDIYVCTEYKYICILYRHTFICAIQFFFLGFQGTFLVKKKKKIAAVSLEANTQLVFLCVFFSSCRRTEANPAAARR